MTASAHEAHLARFTANPDDRVAFEYLEEHLFMQAEWTALADLYHRRCAAPSLQSQARQRAELFMRLAQVCEDRLEDVDAAIAAYSEAVALEPRLRRALRQLRSLFQVRGSWEAVLQISEQEAALAVTREERARAYVEMADVWRRHLGDPEQAELFYARARLEGWSDARAAKPTAVPAAPPTPAVAPAPPAPSAAPPVTAAPGPSLADEFEFYDDLEVDLEVDATGDDVDFEDEPAAPQVPLTMPEFEDEPARFAQRAEGERRPSGGSGERSARVLGVLERKLAARESRAAGLDAESVHLRLRIAELRAGVQADPLAAIAVLEPALESPSALREVAPMLAGLYEQLGHSEPLIELAERAASASEPREQHSYWIRRAAEAARAAGDPERAIANYQRLLGDLPDDLGARAALGDLYRSSCARSCHARTATASWSCSSSSRRSLRSRSATRPARSRTCAAASSSRPRARICSNGRSARVRCAADRSRSWTWSSTFASAPRTIRRAPRCSRAAVRCSPTRSPGAKRPARAGAPRSRSTPINPWPANGWLRLDASPRQKCATRHSSAKS